MKKILTFFNHHRHWFPVVALLLISAVAHSYNMFGFPYYENDEGTYMAQAWAITQGKLAPYTYWYDHAPGGWIAIALWTVLTGGFKTFGYTINSGRVFMLFVHLVSTYVLYDIARKLTGRSGAGWIAGLLFSLSPLALFYQRRVLLDNLMIFWVLLAWWTMLTSRLTLLRTTFSAVCLGIAVLTKESAIFFIPPLGYALWTQSQPRQRLFTSVLWVVITSSMISLYVLYALIKTEFFPTVDKVSLLGTLSYQASRGSNLPFWDINSEFMASVTAWMYKDSWFLVLGVLCTGIVLLRSWRAVRLRVPLMLLLLYSVFLFRGKLILDFYIIPLIPLIALNAGLTGDWVAQQLSQRFQSLRYEWSVGLLGILIAAMCLARPIGQYTYQETLPQKQAIEWVKGHLPNDAYILLDNYAFLDLRIDGKFPNADWYFKTLLDPEIGNKFGNNLAKSQYIFLSHNMLNDFRSIKPNVIVKVFEHAYQLHEWRHNDSSTHLNLGQYISTYGDWAMIYKVKEPHQIILEDSWKYYKQHFIHDYGKVVDPQTGNTTSEGQAYALLRAVWIEDKPTFDGVWQWTKDHLQYRQGDKLLSWLWKNNRLQDPSPASDADQDIALALLFAYSRWHDPRYLKDAQTIINDIWRQEVVRINDRYYLAASTIETGQTRYFVNPSYLFPAAYRVFDQVDSTRSWNQLATDSYWLLSQVQVNGVLPPDWLAIDATTGTFVSAAPQFAEHQLYSYDAFRTFWRTALDWQWWQTPEAKKYAQLTSPPLLVSWQQTNQLASRYNLQGRPLDEIAKLSINTGLLSLLKVTDQKFSNEFYEQHFYQQYNEDGYWQDANNYYDQNWAWFATALHYDQLPNLWK